MEITSDVTLKGSNWRKALDIFSPFFPQSLQPNYSIFIISMSIGIMYDKQLELAGDETDEDRENRASVPRTVLHPHNTDLDFLFQSAILTTTLVEYTEKERMSLAFDSNCDIKINRLDFLSKYANFGVGKLIEHSSDDPIETMEKIRTFLAQTMEGYNYEIDAISDDDISIEDIGDLDDID